MSPCSRCQASLHLSRRYEIVKCHQCGANILTKTHELTDREPPEPNWMTILLGVVCALAVVAVAVGVALY